MNTFKGLSLPFLMIALIGISCTSSPERTTPIREASVIPKPTSAMEATGAFTLNRQTRLVLRNDESEVACVVDYFREYFSEATGSDFPLAESPDTNTITLEL